MLGGYRVLEELGRSPGSTAYLAEADPSSPLGARRVVVEVFPIGADDDAYAHLEHRASAIASIASEHLAVVLGVGRDRDQAWVVTEQVVPGALGCPARRPLQETVRIVAGAARGAHALHEHGFCHRDIRPRTVLVEGTDVGLLGGFASAMQVVPGQTGTSGGSLGEIGFLDPGFVAGEPATRAADIWSLGATLHGALTGEGLYPDAGDDPVAMIRRMLSGPPVLSDDLPAVVRPLVAACLAPDPVERPSTAAELADALLGLLPAPPR